MHHTSKKNISLIRRVNKKLHLISQRLCLVLAPIGVFADWTPTVLGVSGKLPYKTQANCRESCRQVTMIYLCLQVVKLVDKVTMIYLRGLVHRFYDN